MAEEKEKALTKAQAKKLYVAWQKEKEKLALAKEKEMELRKQICAHVLGDTLKGTVTNTDTPGFVVKATAKLGYKIDQEALTLNAEFLTPEEKECFKWVPDLVISKFKPFEEEGSRLLELVTIKPATPTLAIEAE